MADQFIDIDYLKQLLELFDASTASEIRLEKEGVEIRLAKGGRTVEITPTAVQYAPAPVAVQPPAAATTAAQPPATPVSAVESAPAKSYHEVRSPLVGTFYRSPTPDSPAYVEVGSQVSPGAVLCIVEAMKLMNEIECDAYGKIARILVENGQPVEYNQVLFQVELD